MFTVLQYRKIFSLLSTEYGNAASLSEEDNADKPAERIESNPIVAGEFDNTNVASDSDASAGNPAAEPNPAETSSATPDSESIHDSEPMPPNGDIESLPNAVGAGGVEPVNSEPSANFENWDADLDVDSNTGDSSSPLEGAKFQEPKSEPAQNVNEIVSDGEGDDEDWSEVEAR